MADLTVDDVDAKVKRAPPEWLDFFRYEQTSGFGLGRTYLVDSDDRYRCRDCDALLMQRAHRCDPCKARAKAHRVERHKTGRHRA